MCRSCELHIEGLWIHLQVGQQYRTPDLERGADFEISGRTATEIVIQPQGLTIPARAFAATLHYLRVHDHRKTNPCRIASSSDPDKAGPLCKAAREEMPGRQRCINYVVAILAQFDILGVDGRRPNTVWVLP